MSDASNPALTALSNALTEASTVTGTPVEDLGVQSVRAVTWPDGCLGAPSAGEACTEIVSPGYRIRLFGGFVYHADQRGNGRVARREDPHVDGEWRLNYSVSGGLTGQSHRFSTDSWHLSDAEEAELGRLVAAADFFDLRNPDPIPIVPDGIIRELTIAAGRRRHTVIRGDGFGIDESDAWHALVEWVEALPPRPFPHDPSVVS